MPYCLRSINGKWVVVFGVVDPDMRERVGLSNFGWVDVQYDKAEGTFKQNGKTKEYSTEIVVTDPMDSLQQALQLFDTQHDEFRQGRPLYRVLLAQMSSEKAIELAARIRSALQPDFDVVISEASQIHHTPDGKITLKGEGAESPPPIVIVPKPHYDPSGEMNTILFGHLLLSRQSNSRTLQIDSASLPLPDKGLTLDKTLAFCQEVHKAYHLIAPTDVPVDPAKSCPEKSSTSLTLGADPQFDTQKQFQEVVLDQMMKKAHADVALLQEQDFYWPQVLGDEKRIPPATQGLLERILWKDNFLVTLSVPGSVLTKVMAASKKYAQQDEDVLSSEVETHRALVVRGIKEVRDRKSFFINGVPLNDNKVYTVVTSEYMALGGTGYSDLTAGITDAVKTLSQLAHAKLVRISALVCRQLMEPDADTMCADDLQAAEYFDGVGDQHPKTPGPYATAGHELAAALPFYKRYVSQGGEDSEIRVEESPEAQVEGTPKSQVEKNLENQVENVAQIRPYTMFSLERLSFGFSALAHEYTQNGIVRRFSGVILQQASQPKVHSLNLDESMRLVRSLNHFDFYAIQSVLYSATYTQQTNFPASVSQSLNNLAMETGMYWRPWRERTNAGSGWDLVLAARSEAAIVGPEQLFKAANAAAPQASFPVRVDFPRTWLTVGRAGLRGHKGKSSLELGIEGGRAFGALADFRFFSPTTGALLLNCPLSAGLSLGTCVQTSKTLVPGAIVDVSQDDRQRYGLYGRWKLVCRCRLAFSTREWMKANCSSMQRETIRRIRSTGTR